MQESKPGVWEREFEKATVTLDCNDFSGTFTAKGQAAHLT